MSRMYERKMSSPVTAVKTKEEKGDEFDKLLLAPQTYDETNDTKHDVETTRPIDYRGVVLVSFDEDGTIRYYRVSAEAATESFQDIVFSFFFFFEEQPYYNFPGGSIYVLRTDCFHKCFVFTVSSIQRPLLNADNSCRSILIIFSLNAAWSNSRVKSSGKRVCFCQLADMYSEG